jgi:hypothetical protein
MRMIHSRSRLEVNVEGECGRGKAGWQGSLRKWVRFRLAGDGVVPKTDN